MRILQLSSARAFGGGERHLADLAHALAARGHEVYAALAHRSPLLERLTPLPRENILTLPLRNALDLKSAVALARFIRERKVEIVHAHVARDYTLAALAVRLAARRGDAPRLVLTRHVLFPLGRIHRLTFSHVARVIAVSEAVARALRERHIISEDRLRVVPNGVDITRFDRAHDDFKREAYRAQLGAEQGALMVGTVGEISPVKGQTDFVRAVAVVRARSERPVEFLIVGEDASRDGRNRAALEKLITELGLSSVVRLMGRRDDVPQILASLDLFVSASQSEAFGLALVEAMAAGVAVVATDTEGAREIIGADGTVGTLIPRGNPEALAAAMLSLLADEELRASVAARARERARARWSLERMVDETQRVYTEALDE
ncbi:MAG TPA: glycosyltransferase [Pyrinomonadaceae bacterium]|nr:glycosyltransferase [Pyrinomonadaceae bacterium]